MRQRRKVRNRAPWWLRTARRLLPGRVWSGAGVIDRKFYRPPGFADGAKVLVGRVMMANVSGVVPERWVLVVTDTKGVDHYVNVEQAVWEAHEVGDQISAEHPLVDITE